MADDVGVLGAQGRVDEVGELTLDDGGKGDVGEGDALGDEEGMVLEVLLERAESALYTVSECGVKLTIDDSATWETYVTVFGKAYGFGVGSDDAVEQLEDETARSIDLAIRECDPLVNESSLFGVRTQKSAIGRKRDD